MERTYRINQFEKVTGVSAHTLRFFDKIGLFEPDAQRERLPRLFAGTSVDCRDDRPAPESAVFERGRSRKPGRDRDLDFTIQRLKDNRVKLRKKQMELKRILARSTAISTTLPSCGWSDQKLYSPFIDELEAREVGLIRQPTNDIVDFFDAGDVIMKDPAWPHFRNMALSCHVQRSHRTATRWK